MSNQDIVLKYRKLHQELAIDCGNCSGLCCVALYYAKADGFPSNKPAGKPCEFLSSDFQCQIHTELKERGMKGCLAYDCFGAGQKVTRLYSHNINWMSDPRLADEIFNVFRVLFQMHQYLWYLLESLELVRDENIVIEIEELIQESQVMTHLDPRQILAFSLDEYKVKIDRLLLKVSRKITPNSGQDSKHKNYLGKNFKGANLENSDFTMSLLIAANLEGCRLKGANFLGADLRDANIKNTDLSESLFLTQMQINSASGNENTTLSSKLIRPLSWENSK